MNRNQSIIFDCNASRQTRSHSLLFISLLILLLSLKTAKAKKKKKILITLPFPFGYFCCLLFSSALCDVTPVVCQTEGRRCLMRPLSLSFFFFPDSYSVAFIFILFFSKWSPPTQCCDTAFLSSVGVGPYHSFLFFSKYPLSYTHAHSLSLPASSIITPPSIQDTAESWLLSAWAWRTQPLTYASPPWPSATTVLFAVLQIYLSGQGHRLWAFLRGGRRSSIVLSQGNAFFFVGVDYRSHSGQACHHRGLFWRCASKTH